MKKRIKVALVGNPNCGKTTIFNKMTKSKGKVANYPGVTVEKKEGFFSYQNFDFSIVDLPGIYDLNVNSQDEIVARNFILEEKPDVVVNILDSSNIEQGLYLTTQLMELEIPLILVCNKIDLAKAHGVTINFEKLASLLEVEVIETVGIKGEGIEDIVKTLLSTALKAKPSGVYLKFSPSIESEIELISDSLQKEKITPMRWELIKILEKDPYVIKRLNEKIKVPFERDLFQKKQLSEMISQQRHENIARLSKEFLERSFDDKETISDRIDKIVLNKYLGLPIFMLSMFLMFQSTFTLGAYFSSFLKFLLQKTAFFINGIWSEQSLLHSLFFDGILTGVGNVIVFSPNIFLLFIFISFLEESGYMARAAFVMDRTMHKIGLHGKSFIPMIIGFGCTVPAVMATRILENKKDRFTTIFVLPFFSCSAKLVVFTLLIPAFFAPKISGLIMFLLYFLGLVLAVIGVVVLRKTIFKGENIPFIMELPHYQFPSFKTIAVDTLNKIFLFFKKAGTFILAASVLLWFLSFFPRNEKAEKSYDTKYQLYQNRMGAELKTISPGSLDEFFKKSQAQKSHNVQLKLSKESSEKNLSEFEKQFNEGVENLKKEKKSEEINHSFLASLGKFIEPVFLPIGFDWRIDTALFSAFSAKEVFITQLSILFSSQDGSFSSLQQALKANYSEIQGFCILLFLLICTPCIATFAIIRSESSWRVAILQFFLLNLLAYVITFFCYQLFR